MQTDRLIIPSKRPVSRMEKLRLNASVGPGRSWAIIGDREGKFGAPKGRFIEIKNDKGERVEVAESSFAGFIETRTSWGVG